MFNNSSKIMFLLILMTSTMISVSANSWLSAWMGLEINLLAFIPLMSDSNNLMSTEASLKYFLTQALASSVLLFAIILMYMESKVLMENKNFSHMMILSSLLVKSGAAPFHFWFPNVMEGLTWMNSLILMTWQKLAPLMLISYFQFKSFFFACIILSSVIGSLGGLNQTSLRKLMAYSSINHLGWMLTAMYMSETLWISYFFIYSILSFSLVYFFNLFKLFHINQIFTLFFSSKLFKFNFFLNLLSLGGLPPFLGFLPKWLVIQELTINNEFFLTILLTSMTLITLYFYLRLSYSALLLNYHENQWINKINFNNFEMKIIMLMTFISSFGLILISLVYIFM